MNTPILPPLSAVLQREELSNGAPMWVAHCPELDIASQGENVEEARAMLREAVELFLEVAGDDEIQRRLSQGGRVLPLELAA